MVPSSTDTDPVASMTSDGAPHSERRRKPRTTISKLVMIQEPDAPPVPVVLIDVSETGARVRSPKPAKPEARYIMHIKFDGTIYAAPLTPVHSFAEAGHYLWGCEFRSVTTEHLARVHQLTGSFEPTLRPWDEIRNDCRNRPGAEILVGYSPTGREIRLATQDCLHLGVKGVYQFVHDWAWLKDQPPSSRGTPS